MEIGVGQERLEKSLAKEIGIKEIGILQTLALAISGMGRFCPNVAVGMTIADGPA
jgi:hypothetical protein